MKLPNGGGSTGGCNPLESPGIDWILAASGADFSEHTIDRSQSSRRPAITRSSTPGRGPNTDCPESTAIAKRRIGRRVGSSHRLRWKNLISATAIRLPGRSPTVALSIRNLARETSSTPIHLFCGPGSSSRWMRLCIVPLPVVRMTVILVGRPCAWNCASFPPAPGVITTRTRRVGCGKVASIHAPLAWSLLAGAQ